jgi:hypothetical protein
VIVRRLACHAAPSDTAVFDEELRVTLATAPPRSVPRTKEVSVSLNLSMEGGSLVAGSA